MPSRKILSQVRLARFLAKKRAQGRRIVFTNGCFDLLHAGHITLLQKARALGDCLVVGLNSDASVRRLKGPHRPLASQADRARVLSALACVDFVTVFQEDTPFKLVQKLKPTILAKGADYSLDRIVGRDLVAKVVRIPLVKGRSTRRLIKKIVKAYG